MLICKTPIGQTRRRSRRGLLSVEAMVSLGLMAVILAFAGQWSSAMLGYRQRLAQRQEAIQAMDNVVALAMAADFSQVDTAKLLEVAKPHTPTDSQWEIRVEPSPLLDRGGVQQKKIVVSLRYPKRSHDNLQPFVVWRYAPQAEAE